MERHCKITNLTTILHPTFQSESLRTQDRALLIVGTAIRGRIKDSKASFPIHNSVQHTFFSSYYEPVTILGTRAAEVKNTDTAFME